MLFTARIKELEAQLAAVTLERDASASTVAELTQANIDFNARYDADQLVITGLTTERDAARADLVTRTGERDTAVTLAGTTQRELTTERESRETLIFDQVNVRLGAAGVAPIKRDAGSLDTPEGTKGGKAGTPRQRLAAHINAQLAAK